MYEFDDLTNTTKFSNPMADGEDGEDGEDELTEAERRWGGKLAKNFFGGKRIHLTSLDVDSLSYEPSDLIANIERGWLNTLKLKFMADYEEKYKAPWGQGGHWKSVKDAEQLQAEWDAQVEIWRLDPDSPFKVEKLMWPTKRAPEGEEMTDGDEVTSDDLRDMERKGRVQVCVVQLQQVLEKEQGGESTDPSAALTKYPGKKSVTLLFKDLAVKCRGPRDPDADDRQVNLHLMPLKCRVPTDARLKADENSSTLIGGVTAVRVCYWDVCLVWRQIEREEEHIGTYEKLKAYAIKNNAEVHATGVISRNEEKIVVKLFKKLMKQKISPESPNTVVKLTATDISNWIDKKRINQAMERCEAWRDDADKAEHIEKNEQLLAQFQAAMDQLDDEAGYFGGGEATETEAHHKTRRNVEVSHTKSAVARDFGLYFDRLLVMIGSDAGASAPKATSA